MKFLFTSDIHLSPRERDAYRWDIFPWLSRQIEHREIDAVFLLGDITDQKDHHSNRFINRVVDSLNDLADQAQGRLYVIKGNHDYIDPTSPLLRFLPYFYTKPARIKIGDYRLILLPHTTKPVADWLRFNFREYDFALCHQTFRGAALETGFRLDNGAPTMNVSLAGLVISGDVHVPQRVGNNIYYCGSPHHVHFGDTYSPRVLFWNGEELRSISRSAMKRATVSISDPDELSDAKLLPGDQAKVILTLPRSRFGEWSELRARVAVAAKKGGWELASLELREAEGSRTAPLKGTPGPSSAASPADLLARFARLNEVDASLEAFGLEILSGAMNRKGT